MIRFRRERLPSDGAGPIATSADGLTWSDAWTGGTAMVAFAAALEDPLNVTLPFGFERRHARYLRFTQIGFEQIYYWSIAELRIRGTP